MGLFSSFSNNVLNKKVNALAGFELRSPEYRSITLTTAHQEYDLMANECTDKAINDPVYVDSRFAKPDNFIFLSQVH